MPPELLTKSQQNLRGRKVADMTDSQLLEWIDACDRMEKWPHIANKGRRSWKSGREEAQLEIDRRAKKRGVIGAHKQGS